MIKTPISIADIVRDPQWLADRYDPEHDAIHFRRVDRDQHRAATFLTPEYLGVSTSPIAIRRSDVNAVTTDQAPLHFIFHSAYCCSTLLARAFDIPNRSMGLKEPLILNDIVGCLHRGADKKWMTEVLKDVLRLLARPFSTSESVIVKPSNLLNSLVPTIMELCPKANALMLYAPLPIFLKSVTKKGLTGRLWVRDLLIKQLKDDFIDLGFEGSDYLALTDLQVAAVGWLAQQVLFQRMINSLGQSRCILTDSETLLNRPESIIGISANLFGMSLNSVELEAIVKSPSFLNNSKSGAPFSKAQRDLEYSEASVRHADEIEKVIAWANIIADNIGVEMNPQFNIIRDTSRNYLIGTNTDDTFRNAQAELRRSAISLMNSGDFRSALSSYLKLVEIAPDNADDWFNIGYIQRCMRDYTSSIISYRKSIELGARKPEEIHLNMAFIMSEHLNNIDMAIEELKISLLINRKFIPALINLANLFEDTGDRTEARLCYDRILNLEPGNGRAIGRRAIIDVFYSKSPEVIEDLKGKLSKTVLLEDRSEIAFALGHACDAFGMYTEAYGAFKIANESVLERTASLSHYSHKDQENLTNSLLDAFDRPIGIGGFSKEAAPVFICGMFRSGSTLTEQLLSRHSRVTAGGELETIPALIAEQLMPYPMSLIDCEEAVYKKLKESYLAELKNLYPKFDLITDKRPDNFLHIGLIKSIFPHAKIIHTKRNMLDNILSVYFGNFSDSVSYSHRVSDIKHYYDQYSRLMDHWKSLYPQDIFDLDYDQLVEEPDRVMDNLLSFCGLENEVIDYRRPADSVVVKTLSSWQVRQELNQKSSGRWKNYADGLKDAGLIL